MGELDVEIKARVSRKTKERLAKIAGDRGEGVKVSTIVREAVGEYLAKHHPSPAAPPPPEPPPAEEKVPGSDSAGTAS